MERVKKTKTLPCKALIIKDYDYESPVNVIMDAINVQVENDIIKAVKNVGIDVNKEELLRALTYDRQQYERGYERGYVKGHRHGYRKAIHDLLEEMNKYSEIINMPIVRNIAEQLEEGDSE